MAGRFDRDYEIGVADIERLMNCIFEHAGPDEGREAERLLAMLTMLRVTAADRGDGTVTFTAPRGTAPLADRALAAAAAETPGVLAAEARRTVVACWCSNLQA